MFADGNPLQELLNNYSEQLSSEMKEKCNTSLDIPPSLYEYFMNKSLPMSNDTVFLSALKMLQERFLTNEILDPALEYLFTTFYGFVGVSGFFSSLFVFLVIVSSKRLLRNPSNFLLLNLMLSNIVMSVFCIPFTLITVIRQSWPFGSFMCKLIPTFQSSSVSTSSVTIGIIAFDRLIRVTNDSPSHDYRSTRAKSHWIQITIETIIIWASSFIVSIPVWVHQNETVVGFPKVACITKCLESWPPNWRISYTLIVMLIQLVLPSTLLFISHVKIKRHLDMRIIKLDTGDDVQSSTDDDCDVDDPPSNTNQRNRSGSLSTPISGSNPNCSKNSSHQMATFQSRNGQLTTVLSSHDDSNHNQSNVSLESQTPMVRSRSLVQLTADIQRKRLLKKELIRNRRVTNFLLILTITFVLFWLPLNILNIYLDMSPNTKLSLRSIHVLTAVFHLISMTSIPVNSILYGFLNTNIRPEAKQLLTSFFKS